MRLVSRGLGPLFLACALITAIAVSAIGGEPSLPEGPKGAQTLDRSAIPANIITVADVAGTGAGSPDRTLLSAFQAVQFRDVEGLRELTAPGTLARIGAARLKADVDLVGSALGKPFVTSRRATGSRANLRVIVGAYDGSSAQPRFITTQTLSLRREQGRWLLTDLAFVTVPAADLRRTGRG